MNKIRKYVFIIAFLFITKFNALSISIETQGEENIVTVVSEGIAFLGPSMSEDQVKFIALRNAKVNALEKIGTFIQSISTVENYILVRDEITTYTCGLISTEILEEKRSIVDNSFAYKVIIEARIDLKSIDDKIAYVARNDELKQQLSKERRRIKKLEEQILSLKKTSDNYYQNLKFNMNALNASDWALKGYLNNDTDYQIRCYSNAIELDSSYVQAYNNRGIIKSEIGKFGEALSDFKKALSYIKDEPAIYNNIGKTLFKQEKYNEAIDFFRLSIQIDLSYINAYLGYGACLSNLNRNDEAIALYKKALKIEPSNSILFFNIANSYYRKNEYDYAIQLYTKAIAYNKFYIEAYHNRADTYSIIQNFAKAIDDYTKVIELGGKSENVYYYRANAYSSLNNFQQALRDLDEALRINPNFSDAKKFRIILQNME